MRQPDDVALIVDMIIAAEDALRLAQTETYDSLLDDLKLQLALVKLIEIVGEAATKLSQQFRVAAAHVPWDQIIGMRHRLVHDYREIDLVLVWQTTQEDLQPLVDDLRALLPPETSP